MTLADLPFGDAGEPFAPADRPEPAAVLPPRLRGLVEDAIEHLLLLLDELDADADLEDGCDLEETADDEPSLGWTDHEGRSDSYAAGFGFHDADLEEDRADDEWSLGASEADEDADQTQWGHGGHSEDREDNEDSGIADEDALASEDGVEEVYLSREQREAAEAARREAQAMVAAAIGERGGRPYVRDPDSVTLLGIGLASRPLAQVQP